MHYPMKNKTSRYVLIIVLLAISLSSVSFLGFRIFNAKSYNSAGINIKGLSDTKAKDKVLSTLTQKNLSVTLKSENSEKQISFKDLNSKITILDKSEESTSDKTFDNISFEKKFDDKTFMINIQFEKEKLEQAIKDFNSSFSEKSIPEEIKKEDSNIYFYSGKPGKGVDSEKTYALVKEEFKLLENSTVTLDSKEIEPAKLSLDKIYKKVNVPATQPTFQLLNGQIQVNSPKSGTKIDKNKLKALLFDKKVDYDKKIKIPLEQDPPKYTASQAKTMLFRDTLSSKSTTITATGEYGPNKVHNIQLASSSVNGSILLPGQIFSFNAKTGSRGAAQGYKNAYVISGGEFVPGIGGGVCQSATTLNLAVLNTDLQIVSRTSHSYRSSYTDIGLDATVYEGSLDYQFKNTSNFPIKIVGSCSGNSVTFSILGTNDTNKKVTAFSKEMSSTKPIDRIIYKATATTGKALSTKGSNGGTANTYRTITMNGVSNTILLYTSKYEACPNIYYTNNKSEANFVSKNP